MAQQLCFSRIARDTGFDSGSAHDFASPVTFGGSVWVHGKGRERTCFAGSSVVPSRFGDESN